MAGLGAWHAGRVPSAATLRRVRRQLDTPTLEAHLAAWTVAQQPPLSLQQRGRRAIALDGKAVRGTDAHGAPLHLVSLVTHERVQVLGQVAVADKSNEIPAVRTLLREVTDRAPVGSTTEGNCHRRTVADGSADADPNTGDCVYDRYSYQGVSGWLVFGGTSVASPIIASVCRLAGKAGSVTYGWYPYSHSSSRYDVL